MSRRNFTIQTGPLVSVIIPTKNSASTIQLSIESIKFQTYTNTEIIVVDNYSKDATREIARSMGAQVTICGGERSAQRNFGAKIASGDFLLFIDSDMVCERNLIANCVLECLNGGFKACVIPLINTGKNFWARCRHIGDIIKGNDTLNIAPRFIERSTFINIGGYSEELIYGEDKDLARRLIKAGIKFGRINSYLIHIETNSLSDMTRKFIYYGSFMHAYAHKDFSLFLKQINPLRITYFKNLRKIRNPIMLFGFLILKLIEYESTIVGLLLSIKIR